MYTFNFYHLKSNLLIYSYISYTRVQQNSPFSQSVLGIRRASPQNVMQIARFEGHGSSKATEELQVKTRTINQSIINIGNCLERNTFRKCDKHLDKFRCAYLCKEPCYRSPLMSQYPRRPIASLELIPGRDIRGSS